MLGCNERNIIFKQHLCKLGQLQRSSKVCMYIILAGHKYTSLCYSADEDVESGSESDQSEEGLVSCDNRGADFSSKLSTGESEKEDQLMGEPVWQPQANHTVYCLYRFPENDGEPLQLNTSSDKERWKKLKQNVMCREARAQKNLQFFFFLLVRKRTRYSARLRLTARKATTFA